MPGSGLASDDSGAARVNAPMRQVLKPQLRFGPFAVLSERKVRLESATNSATPAAFLRMLEAHPRIDTVEMLDCPGTVDDIANLRLARMIRSRGLVTVVPPGGSIRSGTIELFIAGRNRQAAQDADIVVHAWRAPDGSTPDLVAMDGDIDRAYVKFYTDMGLSQERARDFYRLTSAPPSTQPRHLSPVELSRFFRLDQSID